MRKVGIKLADDWTDDYAEDRLSSFYLYLQQESLIQFSLVHIFAN